jgi:uncharacterized protein (DUF1330 family)
MLLGMSAYVVVDVQITDAGKGAEYSKLSGPSVERHGGRYVGRGSPAAFLEGDWNPDRVVVIEFASVEAAKQWYDSEDYRHARRVREGAGTWRMVVVEGT